MDYSKWIALFKMKGLSRLFARWRHPHTLPEEVASILDLDVSNYLTYEEFISLLKQHCHPPKTLTRFMPREQAERTFFKASYKEHFCNESHFSYCFKQGVIDFTLTYDGENRLRRLYLNHRGMELDQKLEIPLHNKEINL